MLAIKLPRNKKAAREKYSWRRFCLRLVGTLVAIRVVSYVLLAPIVAEALYSHILFFPLKFPGGYYSDIKINGLAPSDVFFKSESGNQIHGWLFQKPGAKRVVMLSHGNAFNLTMRNHIIERFLNENNDVFIYDYSGFGRSEGEPSIAGFYKDARSAYNFLIEKQKYTPSQVILFGESLGTLVSGKLASVVPCAGVILECPLHSLRRVACEHYGFLSEYPDWAWPESCKQLDNSVALHKPHPPLVMAVGTSDGVTSIGQSDALNEAVIEPKNYVRINGALHGDDVMHTSPVYKRARLALFGELP
ncbi:alpha/beta hydrolase [soil metagenome]